QCEEAEHRRRHEERRDDRLRRVDREEQGERHAVETCVGEKRRSRPSRTLLRPSAVKSSQGEWRRRESNPLLLGASEAPIPMSFIPERSVRTGGVEPPQPWATGLRPVELAGAQRPPEKGDRPDSNRYREDHHLECCRY